MIRKLFHELGYFISVFTSPTSALRLVLSSVFSCLETLMKHSPSFMKYYFKYRSVRLAGPSIDQPLEVIKGCLNIVGNHCKCRRRAHSAVAGALSGIFGSVLSLATPSQPDLATVFIEKVRVELQKFNQKLQRNKFHGLTVRGKNINSSLKTALLSATEDVDLSDRVLFETDRLSPVHRWSVYKLREKTKRWK